MAEPAAEFVGVLLILAFGALLVVALLVAQARIGPRRSFLAKREVFDCGEASRRPLRRRFAVRFYLVAILFVVFDAAALYFYAFGASFKQLGLPGLIAIAVFALPLGVGLVYEWKKGALEW